MARVDPHDLPRQPDLPHRDDLLPTQRMSPQIQQIRLIEQIFHNCAHVVEQQLRLFEHSLQ